MTINFFSVIDSFTGKYGAADGLFQAGCDFMALPIVTVMVPVLAFGFVIHIIYAAYLTWCNIQSRGGYKRYEVASKAKTESWASTNMFALGIIVLGILGFHLSHFWADMQLQEFMGSHAENPYELLNATFGTWWMTLLYIVWFGALGFHLTHGFWSAFQTVGLSNGIWEKRLQVLGYIFTAVVIFGFVAVAVNAFCHANGLIF